MKTSEKKRMGKKKKNSPSSRRSGCIGDRAVPREQQGVLRHERLLFLSLSFPHNFLNWTRRRARNNNTTYRYIFHVSSITIRRKNKKNPLIYLFIFFSSSKKGANASRESGIASHLLPAEKRRNKNLFGRRHSKRYFYYQSIIIVLLRAAVRVGFCNASTGMHVATVDDDQ